MSGLIGQKEEMLSNWQEQIYEATLRRREQSAPHPSRTKRTPKTDYKAIFLTHLKLAKLPEPVCEFRFHESRKWRFDYAWPDSLIACEYQGLAWKGEGVSGHQSVDGLRNDCEKFTEASLAGWRLILITAETVNSGQAAEWIRRAFEGRERLDRNLDSDLQRQEILSA